jgi:hypothetical protein
MHTGFWRESQNKRDHYEDLHVGGGIILKWIKRVARWGGMDWIDLALDRDQRRALVNMLTKLQVPYDVGTFLSS